jgi:hypothetical protein
MVGVRPIRLDSVDVREESTRLHSCLLIRVTIVSLRALNSLRK